MSTDTAPIEQTVLDTLKTFEPEVEPTPGATLEELDVDSLDLAEVAQVIEEELGVRLEAKDMKQFKVVQDVIDLIASRGA